MEKLFHQFPLELKQEVVEYRKSKYKSKKKSNKPKNLSKKSKTKVKEYAFPELKKLPLDTERQIKSALHDFDKVKGVTLVQKREAYEKIINSANRYSICTMVLSSKFEHCLFNPDSKEPENN